MLFIYTCSQDGAVDILSSCIKDLDTFRFDIDKQADYTWNFSRSGFEISNIQTHSIINSNNLSSFYRRKPIFFDRIDIPKDGCLENWCRSEVIELFDDFYNDCTAHDKTVLIHGQKDRYGKLRQMCVAENYFPIANWHIFHGILPDNLRHGRWVAKSLTGTQIGKGKVFFVKEIDPTKLDLSYNWFLQEKIDGEDEVTVVYVNGELFAYRYPRLAIGITDDVRLATHQDPSKWEPCSLSPSEQSAIRGFMAETGYAFGRFDFIRKDGELWFLELNPNGQWAWLDEDNKDGLISAIADAIIAEDRQHAEMTRIANLPA